MLNDPRLILIGSGGRNSGKTYLAVKLISRYAQQGVYALKVTGVEALGLCCARGGEGCGACRLEQDYVLSRETDAASSKDTALMLAAGAREVWWLRSLRGVMEKAYLDFSARIPAGALVIAESNSLRHFVQPALFIMLTDPAAPRKKSAAEVAAYANFDVTPPLDDTTLAAIIQKVPQTLIKHHEGSYGGAGAWQAAHTAGGVLDKKSISKYNINCESAKLASTIPL